MRADGTPLETIWSFSNYKADITLVISALVATASVGLNLYGGILQERKRADLQLEVHKLFARLNLLYSLDYILKQMTFHNEITPPPPNPTQPTCTHTFPHSRGCKFLVEFHRKVWES